MSKSHAHDPLRPHSHEPNPAPPSASAQFTVVWGEKQWNFTPETLGELHSVTVTECYIVSTGHGTSGPFTFTGPTLLELIADLLPADADWSEVAVVSGDGFGVRLYREEVTALSKERPAILAHTRDGRPLTREDGLVRLIEPNETDDALRQVKWVAEIRIK